jgi:hypothetical protein
MSSSSLVTGTIPLGCMGSPQPGHRTTGKVSGASLSILLSPKSTRAKLIAGSWRFPAIIVAQMPRVAKIDSCPLKKVLQLLDSRSTLDATDLRRPIAGPRAGWPSVGSTRPLAGTTGGLFACPHFSPTWFRLSPSCADKPLPFPATLFRSRFTKRFLGEERSCCAADRGPGAILASAAGVGSRRGNAATCRTDRPKGRHRGGYAVRPGRAGERELAEGHQVVTSQETERLPNGPF